MVTDQLRRAMSKCGETRYAIAKATGIRASVLSRFAAGGGLRSPVLDKLCKHLRLELKPEGRTGKGGRG